MIFVADSQEARMEANVESLANLEKNLKEQGYDLKNVPYALQLNNSISLGTSEPSAARVTDAPPSLSITPP